MQQLLCWLPISESWRFHLYSGRRVALLCLSADSDSFQVLRRRRRLLLYFPHFSGPFELVQTLEHFLFSLFSFFFGYRVKIELLETVVRPACFTVGREPRTFKLKLITFRAQNDSRGRTVSFFFVMSCRWERACIEKCWKYSNWNAVWAWSWYHFYIGSYGEWDQGLSGGIRSGIRPTSVSTS